MTRKICANVNQNPIGCYAVNLFFFEIKKAIFLKDGFDILYA